MKGERNAKELISVRCSDEHIEMHSCPSHKKLNHRANRCGRYKNNRDATTNNAERVAISKNDEWWWREIREKRDGRRKEEIGKRRERETKESMFLPQETTNLWMKP